MTAPDYSSMYLYTNRLGFEYQSNNAPSEAEIKEIEERRLVCYVVGTQPLTAIPSFRKAVVDSKGKLKFIEVKER